MNGDADAHAQTPDPDEPGSIDLAEDGLAGERTDLAWGRSGLALMACGAAIAKGLPSLQHSPAEPVIGFLVLVLGGAIWAGGWLGTRREQRTAHRLAVATGVEPVRTVPQERHLRAIAYGTAAVGVSGFLLALRLG